MILLDTSVISEPLRREPEPSVVEWIDAQALETLYLSAITVAELRSGIALLPTGKRRTGLLESLERRVLPLFTGRVLPFDRPAPKPAPNLSPRPKRPGWRLLPLTALLLLRLQPTALRWPHGIPALLRQRV